jgi:hypothetical protein
MPQTIQLADLRLDGGSQLRVRLDEAAVADYVEALKEEALTGKVTLPPGDVFDNIG